jgi:tetratricopeptide (TPR) repeat protein
MVDLHIRRDAGSALHHAKLALERYFGPGGTRKQTRMAPAYLACARAYMQQGETSESVFYLLNLQRNAIISPRHLSMACHLIASYPDEDLMDSEDAGLVKLARDLARFASSNIPPQGNSPVCLSALGTSEYLLGSYQNAIDYLNRALAVRGSWPEGVRKYNWPEDARDYYLLAMARFKLGGPSEDGASGLDCYEAAEALYNERENWLEGADIIDRIREKAGEIFKTNQDQ